MSKKHISAGTTQAYFGFVDSLGFLLGETTTAPTNGTLQAMLRLLGIQSAAAGLPESEDVNIPGDDETLGTITFAPDETPAFVANFGANDLDFNARIQQTAVETIGGMDFGVLQPNDPGAPNGTLILQGKAVDKDAGTAGQAMWTGQIFPLVTASPLGRESFEGRAAGVYRVKFTAQKASKKPWGVTIADGDLGTDGASVIEFGLDHPLLMDRITGDGSTTEFTLTKALAATDHLAAFVNTQQMLQSGGVTGTVGSTTITFSSAPAAGAKVIVLYGFQP